MDVPSLNELLDRYRAEWQQWIGALQVGDMLDLELDSDAPAVLGTDQVNIVGVLMGIRSLPPRNGIIDTVMDVWVNTLIDGTPRGHLILGYVDVRKLSVVSRCERE